MNCKIKTVSPLTTYAVRHPVLRQGKPIASCAFPGDEDPTSLHLAAVFNEDVIGVVSVFTNATGVFSDLKQMQLRGMAVLPEAQGSGIGKMLVHAAEIYAKERGTTLLWFNARINAVHFYERLGYQIMGEAFEIEGIGTHYLMYKYLKKTPKRSAPEF